MSAIVTSILSSTVGLLWNHARDTTADKLRESDVNDTKIRQLIVRELNEINTKLDGISRKDLLSSYSFLKEGVELFNISIDKSNLDEKNAVSSETGEAGGEESGRPRSVQSSILNEALQLSNAVGKLKINSDKEFESAKERFKDARKKATEAFCNESLSIEDRLFAAKLRVVSEILEHLETPEAGITGCMTFLQDLHDLPAIRETFSVFLADGFWARFNKDERSENIKSVMLINYILFQYCSKFTTRHTFLLSWPTIQLDDSNFRPILDWQKVSTKTSMVGELPPPPNEPILDARVPLALSGLVGFNVNLYPKTLIGTKDNEN